MSLHLHRYWPLCLAAGIVAMAMAACDKPAADIASSTTRTRPDPSATVADAGIPATDPDSPCRLLTDAEVRAVFPNAGPGERERTREQYGIAACVWSGDFGRFVAQTWEAKGNTAEQEARGLSNGFVDPLNPAAGNSVRYESVAGVGEQASAIVESQDTQRGILTDIAMLVARKDGQMLVLMSDDLTHRDRSEALAKLQSLARSAAARL